MNFRVGATLFGFALVLAFIVTWFGWTWVGTGHIGVARHTDGTITKYGQGFNWVGYTTIVQEYPTYLQSLVLSNDPKEGGKDDTHWSVGTADQQELPVNTNLTWNIDTDKALELYQAVGGNDVDYVSSKIVQPTMKNVANAITHKYGWNYIKGDGQAKVAIEINTELGKELAKAGIKIGTFGFSHVGSPQGMEQAQQQLAASELATKQAEQAQAKAKIENDTKVMNATADAKSQEIKAQGESKANELLRQSVTRELIDYEMAKHWDGKYPISMGGNSWVNLPPLPAQPAQGK